MFRGQWGIEGSKAEPSGVRGFASQWFVAVSLASIVGGCEVATTWTDNAVLPIPVDEELDNTSVPDTEENERTTVTCKASPSSVMGSSSVVAESANVGSGNATEPVCPSPPCGIERGLNAKSSMTTVYFEISPHYFATSLGLPMLTLTGTRKVDGASIAHETTYTQTFGPFPEIVLNDVDHTVALTVDASAFVEVTSANLSWVPQGPTVGTNASSPSTANLVETCLQNWWCPSPSCP